MKLVILSWLVAASLQLMIPVNYMSAYYSPFASYGAPSSLYPSIGSVAVSPSKFSATSSPPIVGASISAPMVGGVTCYESFSLNSVPNFSVINSFVRSQQGLFVNAVPLRVCTQVVSGVKYIIDYSVQASQYQVTVLDQPWTQTKSILSIQRIA